MLAVTQWISDQASLSLSVFTYHRSCQRLLKSLCQEADIQATLIHPCIVELLANHHVCTIGEHHLRGVGKYRMTYILAVNNNDNTGSDSLRPSLLLLRVLLSPRLGILRRGS